MLRVETKAAKVMTVHGDDNGGSGSDFIQMSCLHGFSDDLVESSYDFDTNPD